MSAPVELRAAFRSDVGMTREKNEDACFAGDHIFAVADGLGGHLGGEVASNLALISVAALDEASARAAADKIADAVRDGNRAVYDRAQKDVTLKGMGTTMTAVAVYAGTANLAHVGDSRCYLIRGNDITQLSRDHTLVARMVSEGKLTVEQAETHPQRSILTRALGAERIVEVDELRVVLVPGDRLVLCSDGLTTVLADDEIRRLATESTDLDEVCGALIEEANARGGPDNITAIVVDVSGTGATGAPGAIGRARRGFGFARNRRGGAPARARDARPSRVPIRLLVWLTVLLGVVIGGTIGVRTWANHSFYVGVQGDQVAIYRGLPVSVGALHLSHVEEPTTLRTKDVAPSLLSKLLDGIRRPSLASARAYVAELPRAHEPEASPSPKPPTAKPTTRTSP